MNITLIRSNKRKNSTTYNSAEYLISKLENVDKVYEFTLPEDMPGNMLVSLGAERWIIGLPWSLGISILVLKMLLES